MEEDFASQIETAAPAIVVKRPPRQSPGAAFASAVLPGLGQLVLGEKRKAIIYFVLLAIWIFLFFPPVQSPRNWTLWGNQELFGILFAIISAYQALRSRADGKRPGHLALLIALIPIAGMAMAAAHHFTTRAAGFRDFRVTGKAMQPTLGDGDLVMVSLHEYRRHPPARGEIVVAETSVGTVVKRVIGEEGDNITGKDGRVIVNGVILDEPYLAPLPHPVDPLRNFGPITVPPHKFFLLGDNRYISLDSRLTRFGTIDQSAIQGRALYDTRSGHETSRPLR